MKRPEQHVTDSQGDAIFRAAFAQWAVNPSELDYGWDYVVELFRDGKSTGLTFNAQLKSSLHTEFSSGGTFISQSLERDAADYLARQLHQPTFLFHASINTKQLFWSAIQLDQSILAALEKGETQSLTVRIPASNVLPGQLGRFLGDLTSSQTVVVSRILLGTKAADFVDAMREQPINRITKVAGDLHEKAFRLDLQAAHDQMRGRNLTEAVAAVRRVLANSSGYLEIQFNATRQLGELQTLELSRSDKPQSLVAYQRLATAQALCRIAQRVPKHLHLFAQATRKAAELGVAVQEVLGLLMSWRITLSNGDDPIWLAVVSFKFNEGLMGAHRKYRQSLRLAQATARSRFRWIIPRPIVDIAVQVTLLAGLLETCNFSDAAREYRSSAFQLLKFAAAIAWENENIDELLDVLMNARMLETEKDGEVFLWIRSIVDRWSEEKEYRKIAEELLHRWVARKDGATFEGDIQTNARQIHYNILTSAGIDPTTEPWNSLIDLAIKDDDPPASSWNVSISGLCGRLQTILCLAALGWDGPTPKLSIARSIDTP